MTSQPGFSDKVAFIWSLAELLRGDVKAHEYGQFVLPFLVLRRLECALEPTKPQVQGTVYWLYEGQTLDERRRELEGVGAYGEEM